MKEHTLTITFTEKYVPDGDEAEFQASIDRVMSELVGRVHLLVERHLWNDIVMTIAVTHPKEPA